MWSSHNRILTNDYFLQEISVASIDEDSENWTLYCALKTKFLRQKKKI